MLGITGVSSDMREIEKAAEEGNERAILGLKMYRYRIKKYIGAYAASMGGLDLLIFTGGIGENDPVTRDESCKGLEYMGIEFDSAINQKIRGKETLLSKPTSKVKVMTIPTNEELIIAEHTFKIVSEMAIA
jgi:acetate kinase